MPTNEYECLSCGYRFEEFQQMTDAPLEQCPECQGKVKRLIGAAAGLSLKEAVFTLLITGVNRLQRRQGKAFLKVPTPWSERPLRQSEEMSSKMRKRLNPSLVLAKGE